MANSFRTTHRKIIRLQGYDYSTPGGYFITQGTQFRRSFFTDIESGKCILTDAGTMVRKVWYSLEKRFFPFVAVDAFVIMPDHIHGIIFITDGEPYSRLESLWSGTIPDSTDSHNQNSVPAALGAAVPTISKNKKRPSLFEIIGAFKSITTVQYIRGVNNLGWVPFSKRLWQRMYYERIIRNESDLRRIRRYIMNNPLRNPRL